ncbi:penicillin-binding transpeptidase domain-containing protein [Ornithinimicrobium sp. INDO-MA30-4]|uniref:penicillin-binding transpeptidase domain-containing protein n=1 Tax=Ornithinimicrobium sp. INDO-MA30-4 TaxID=2908651 RepID=UPI001F3E1FDE|nr:penicillin-binding transpeptidase domain-containing protein [Ornithinimicrobium sp. INDO-MA30-4]UJH70462.1 hypothetical protein L0A91_15350 [Ornithinimicrobium sp. INDO-MA30-4]
MASNVGTCDIQDTMTTLGLLGADGDVYGLEENDFSPAPNLILGSDDASPLTVANAYATIASGGVKCPAMPVTKIVDAQGEEIPLDLPECERVIDADVAAGVAELMQGVTDISGSGWRAALDSGQPVAGKTGTDDLSLQTWFAATPRRCPPRCGLARLEPANTPARCRTSPLATVSSKARCMALSWPLQCGRC